MIYCYIKFSAIRGSRTQSRDSLQAAVTGLQESLSYAKELNTAYLISNTPVCKPECKHLLEKPLNTEDELAANAWVFRLSVICCVIILFVPYIYGSEKRSALYMRLVVFGLVLYC